MPEAVIVSTARSAIGRAFKGSLKDERPDDIAAQIVKAALAKVPELDSAEIGDLMMGCGSPAGEQGFNIARVVAVMAGLENVPGVTVNRYCSSSLQTIRMAAHAIKAGEGDAFISAGVEFVSRYGNGASDSGGATNPIFGDAQARTAARAEGGADTWSPPEGLPDVYIAMGQTAENVAQQENVTREAMDEWGVRSQNRAEAAIERGFFENDITPVTLSDGSVYTIGRRPPRRRQHRGCEPAQAGVPARRQDHGSQRVPSQRRRGRRDRHVATRGPRSSASRRSLASSPPVSPDSTPRSWAWARSRPASRRWPVRA